MPKRVGSGRKALAVASLFNNVITTSKIPKVECTFCSKRLTKNGTRMSKHLQECKKCPDSVKEKYKKTTKPEVQHSGLISPDLEKLTNVASTSTSTAYNTTKKQLKTPDVIRFVDKMNPEDQNKADKLLSRAIFASRAPLSMMENPHWTALFAFLRPAYKIPSRHMLSGPFLENEYRSVSALVAEAIAAAHSVGLAADGWTNIRNEPIINFVVTTPKPFLYKVLPTGKSSHTAEFMAQEISSVIGEIGSQKVFGVVTDNAANMKAAWRLLEMKYARTNLFTYGCLAHSLQLIFTDMKTLPTLKTLTADATACIKAIKNSHKLNTAFIEKQLTTGVNISLKLPVKTRWGSLVFCLESLKENKQAIKAMAIDENLSDVINKVHTLKVNMLNDVFWDKITGYTNLLKPISDTITIVESDTPRMSQILSLYRKIEINIEDVLGKTPLLKTVEKRVKEILKNRKEFALYDVHKIANLLDPHFKGCDLTSEEEAAATELCQHGASAT